MRIIVHVAPRSRRNALQWEEPRTGKQTTCLKAWLTAPPADGAANAALIALLAQQLSLPRTRISIVQGMTSRQKLVEIAGLSLEDLVRVLARPVGAQARDGAKNQLHRNSQ